MNREEILKKVLQIAVRNYVLYADEVKQINADTATIDYLDSMDKTELTMYIEREFDISVTDAEVESCETFGSIADLVAKHLD